MHQLIKDHLEDFLANPHARAIPREFQAHLESCNGCAQELKVLGNHSRLLRDALTVKDAEPGPGFYARVMNRVEQRAEESVWWAALMEPAFGRRLAIACGTLALVLGTYLATTEISEHPIVPPGVVMTDHGNAAFEDGTVPPRERDAVLVNLVSYPD